MRSNKDAFYSFCDNLLPGVVGKVTWKHKVTRELVRDIATPSDEAFVYLLLENNWKVWKEAAKREEKKARADDAVSELDEEDESSQEESVKSIASEYTDANPKGGKNSGWSENGMKRYNELCIMVKADRASNGDCDKAYLEHAKKTKKCNKRKRKVEYEVEPMDDWEDLLGGTIGERSAI